ncbi:MAG: hypothetical protein WC720_05010 [Candidatus Shapirobacteria bacterium]|jgi:hypothetical protein
MNLITIIQSALTALNNTSELFLLERARAENEELNHEKDVIVIFPDWRTSTILTQGMELSKARVYNIDFKTPDEWDNSDGSLPTSYESKTSADRIELMETLADSIFSYISSRNDLFPEIKSKLQWKTLNPILRANNGTMSGVSIQLTVVFAGEKICDYEQN